MEEARELINNLARLSAAYESMNEKSQSDTITLNEAYDRVLQNWKVIQSNVTVVKKQLQQVPVQWKEFIEKYTQV